MKIADFMQHKVQQLVAFESWYFGKLIAKEGGIKSEHDLEEFEGLFRHYLDFNRED
jgi:hypothetical protein